MSVIKEAPFWVVVCMPAVQAYVSTVQIQNNNNNNNNNIKKERARRLIEIDNDLQLKYNQKFIGKKVNVLIEEIIDGQSIGHTQNFLKIIINQELNTNTCYDVLIVDSDIDYVVAKVEEK